MTFFYQSFLPKYLFNHMGCENFKMKKTVKDRWHLRVKITPAGFNKFNINKEKKRDQIIYHITEN